MKPNLQIVQSISRIICVSCGAEANASCNCGASYMPVSVRVAEAIKASPQKSDRAIAANLGVSPTTVGKARQVSSGGHVARIGRDGKRYPARRPEPQIADPVKEINLFHKEAISFLDDFTRRFDEWHDGSPLINRDGKAALMQAFYLCADGFARLAQKLDGR